MSFYFDSYSYSDPDPMLDIDALSEEQRAAHELGYICFIDE